MSPTEEKKSEHAVEGEFSLNKQCKGSVRYDGKADKNGNYPVSSSIYVSKTALAGAVPQAIRVKVSW